MEHAAAAVFHLRPVHFAALAVVAVFLGPLLRLRDRVDLLALAVHQRNVGVDEAVPVAVKLLDSAHHSLVNFRDMAPAGCRQNIEDSIVVLIEQGHGVQSSVLPVCRFLSDNVVRVYRRGVHGVVGTLYAVGLQIFKQLHHDGALCKVVADGIVHIFGHVSDREGVQNNVGALKLRPVILKGQRFGGRFGVLVYVRIEDVHDIDRADIPDGIVKMLGESFAECEVGPVLCISELALSVAHVGELDRHIDEIHVGIAPDQVYRCGADIGGYDVGLRGARHFAVADFAVGSMFISHNFASLS